MRLQREVRCNNYSRRARQRLVFISAKPQNENKRGMRTNQMLKTPIGRLRLIGYCEAVSFLVLLGIAMPLKYAVGLPEAVLVVGWLHGLLFMLFVAAVAQAASVRKWSYGKVLVALAASVLPFGPFFLDGRLRREEQSIVRSQ